MRQTLYEIPFNAPVVLSVWGVIAAIVVGRTAMLHGWRQAAGYLPVLCVGGAIIWFVLPNLIEASGLPIRGYGVMLLLAVASGVGLSVYRARQFGFDSEAIYSLAFWLFLSGIVGARLFYVIEYWERSFHKPTLTETLLAVINIPQGGLVVYGSLIAGGAALVVFVFKHKLNGLALADLVAPGVVLGMALGRVGCFLNGCCYGGACDYRWAVQFPAGTPPFEEQVQRGVIPIDGITFKGGPGGRPEIESVEPDSPAAKLGLKKGDQIATIETATRDPDGRTVQRQLPVETVDEARGLLARRVKVGERVSLTLREDPTKIIQWTVPEPAARTRPIHPAQLYSAIDAGLLCFFLLAYTPYRRRDGEVAALAMTIHPISRYLLEEIRIDESPVFGTALSISQNISVILLAGAAVLWIYVYWRGGRVSWSGSPPVPNL